MSDLTDEEIIATRKLNGVDDDLYRKIDVGEYIRTNKGNIGKIIEIRLGFNLAEDIKIVSTKEQMEANCYKVGGEDE